MVNLDKLFMNFILRKMFSIHNYGCLMNGNIVEEYFCTTSGRRNIGIDTEMRISRSAGQFHQ